MTKNELGEELSNQNFIASTWNTKFKLCYVEGSFAYFTTQDLDKQWGDDWDDAPYQHNAGTPYSPFETIKEDWNDDGSPKWEILKLAFDGCNIIFPSDEYDYWSVQQINAGKIPWMRVWLYRKLREGLMAGATIDEFIDFVQNIADGEVYLPLKKDGVI